MEIHRCHALVYMGVWYVRSFHEHGVRWCADGWLHCVSEQMFAATAERPCMQLLDTTSGSCCWTMRVRGDLCYRLNKIWVYDRYQNRQKTLPTCWENMITKCELDQGIQQQISCAGKTKKCLTQLVNCFFYFENAVLPPIQINWHRLYITSIQSCIDVASIN